MSHFRGCFLLALAFIFPLFLGAQKLDSMMNIYANNFPQEKIHIQFDKKLYNPGETIWFKAYVFSGADPSLFSKNFYAELSDPEGNILFRKAYPISESSTAGNFDLPKTIKGRHVHFRAYTTWMTNFDSAFYFEMIHVETPDIPKMNYFSISIKRSLEKLMIFPFFCLSE